MASEPGIISSASLWWLPDVANLHAQALHLVPYDACIIMLLGLTGPTSQAAAPACRAYCLSECTQVCAASITGVPAAPVSRE